MAFRTRTDAQNVASAVQQTNAYAGRQYGLDIVSGTKYSHLGGKRHGISSVQDSDIVKKNLEQRTANYGDGGYTFMMLNPDGSIKDKATIDINGRIFKSRTDGTFHIVDTSMIDVIEEEQKERDEYIRNIVKKCAIGDAVAAHILGLDVKYFLSLCKSGGVNGAGNGLYESIFQMPYNADDAGDLDKYNCRPSFLHALDQNSTTFSGALSKLKAIVLAFLPILEETTPNSSVTEKGAKSSLNKDTATAMAVAQGRPVPEHDGIAARAAPGARA